MLKCNYDKHFMITGENKACKHIYNNLKFILFYFYAKAKPERCWLGHLLVAAEAEGMRSHKWTALWIAA